jgi:hypothetical protein
MRVFVEGVGLLGPGLNGWHTSRQLLAGNADYIDMPIVVTADESLPAAERRRIGLPVKLALAAARAAFVHAERDAATTATVFTSSDGDGENIHHICSTLASPQREISPTRFHNSVHNAAAGYWSIAIRSHAQSTSLCCYDASFAAGLLDAAAQIAVDGKPVALIAYDQPYPEPLHAMRPISASFGMALVMAPHATARAFASLEVNFVAGAADATRMTNRGLETMRAGVPAARSLPLLCALARAATEVIILEYAAGCHVHVQVAPC